MSTRKYMGNTWALLKNLVNGMSTRLGKLFWYPFATFPTSATTLLGVAYLVEYFNFSWYVALGSSFATALVINILTLMHQPSFIVYMLCIPELMARILRIYMAQIAILYSPLPQIQINMQTFMRASTCTTKVALEVGRNATRHLVSRALDVGRNLVLSLNEISDDIENTILTPLQGLSRALEEISKISQQLNNVKSECSLVQKSLGGSCSAVLSGLEGICSNVFSRLGLGGACSNINSINNACNGVSNNGLCNVFSEIGNPQIGVDALRDLTNSLKSEFTFQLKLQHGFHSKVSNTTIEGIRASYDEHIEERFDTLFIIKQIFGYMICFSILYLVITKVILLKKFNEGQSINTNAISKFFIASNPFTIQLLILGLLAFLDYGIRFVYGLQKVVLDENVVELETKFNAGVTSTGGSVGTLLSNAITRTFELYDSLQISLDLGSCFEKELVTPSIVAYTVVPFGLILGIMTYKIDSLCRNKQEGLIRFANHCYDSIFVSKKL